MPSSLLRPSSLAFALATVISWPAAAADAADDPRHKTPVDIDKVVVTANTLRTTAEDMVEPVEVLAGEKLDEAKGATLGETVGKLPGVQSSNFGQGVGRPIIRGLDNARVATLTGGLSSADVSTVSQDHNVTIEPFLADQIEVLKGPATLLYGSGAIGGVVNTVDGRIAEKPMTETVSGRAEARYDDNSNGWTGMGRVDAMGANGALVLHADGVYRDLEDYDTPLGRQANSFIRTKTGALGASLVGDAGFFGMAASRYEDRYGNPGEPGNPAEGEPSVFIDMKQTRIEAKAGLTQPFWIFSGMRASVAHSDYEHTEFEGSEVGTRFLNDGNDGRLEFTHKAWGPWFGAFGMQFGNRTFAAIGEEAFVPQTHSKEYGLFVTEQGKWEHLQLDLGARTDDIKRSPQGSADRKFTPLSLSAGALWRFNDAWRVSLNLDRAERAPVEEELFADGPHAATASVEIGDAGLDKERANQAEIGLHYHGARFEAKLAAYETRFDGFIYLVDTGLIDPEEGLPIRQWSQADAKFRGFEGEGIFHVFDNDENGRLDARIYGDTVRATLDEGGNLPRIAPARLGAELRWNGEKWRASVGGIRYAKQDEVAAGETPTDGYTLVDAHVAYHFDYGSTGWEMFLDGSNLTDEEARVHTSFLKDTVVLPGRGVTFGVRTFF
jgi:iron complex outermembrane recepter protein